MTTLDHRAAERTADHEKWDEQHNSRILGLDVRRDGTELALAIVTGASESSTSISVGWLTVDEARDLAARLTVHADVAAELQQTLDRR